MQRPYHPRAKDFLSVGNLPMKDMLHPHPEAGFLSEGASHPRNWSISSMHIKTPSQKTLIKNLSGGNQQKVILGRWLLTQPEVLLLDEPTRGIDVGAKYEIYELILQLAKQGKAVMMVSSEMPELIGICDRILVMSNGRMAGILERGKDFGGVENEQETIMRLAAQYV